MDTDTYRGDDPVRKLLEDLRDWFRDSGMIAGVSYHDASILQEIEKVLFRWPTPVGHNVTPGMTELTILRKAVEAWQARADDLQTLRASERLMVLDTRGRAYSQSDSTSFKLEIPRTTFTDVFLMDRRGAEAVQTWLTRKYAEFAPYSILDAHTYAQQQARETSDIVAQLESPLRKEPASEGVEPGSEEPPSETFSP